MYARPRYLQSADQYRLHPWVLVLALSIGWPFATLAGTDTHWAGVAGRIAQHLSQAAANYAKGDPQSARRKVIESYFSEFEGSKMEAAMRMEFGATHTWLAEKRFAALRKAIKKRAAADEVAHLAQEIASALKHDAQQLDQAGIAPEVFARNPQ